ncbi:hypothetical protein EVAR_99119_1 [Eumeta japonica]|uniref:Uncharacterized protein n=1 Tax=Eumeta variegata TaxID=151549 RepID=A0A4C1YQW5_EUMVA|nr:hypothetical protein EVAR_99119_1 [Eumeta japonica]
MRNVLGYRLDIDSMMIVEIIILLITGVFGYFYYVHRKMINDLGAKGVKMAPALPMFGSFLKSNFGQRHLLEDVYDCYNSFPEERIEKVRTKEKNKDHWILNLRSIKRLKEYQEKKIREGGTRKPKIH